MKKRLSLPEHAGTKAHQRLMKKWAENPDVVVRASLQAGVHKQDGTLESAYQD
ncbi:MAG: hypothetical protein AAFX40_19305 [Cyanobacteria bacterium J06639_1]